MVGWHNQLNSHEFEQTPGDNEGQGSLACCSPWDRRVRKDLVAEQQVSPYPQRVYDTGAWHVNNRNVIKFCEAFMSYRK